MIPEDNAYEGIVQTTDRTERELEPLRLLVFRMAAVRDQVAAIEGSRERMNKRDRHGAIRRVCVKTEEIISEVKSFAEPVGQLADFEKNLAAKYGEAPRNWRAQIIAAFRAVDVFLVANNLVRTVEAPDENIAEALWQKCLEEHATRYGSEPHDLDVTKLSIFKDACDEIIYKSNTDRHKAFNDSLSSFAMASVVYKKGAQAPERLPNLDDLL